MDLVDNEQINYIKQKAGFFIEPGLCYIAIFTF